MLKMLYHQINYEPGISRKKLFLNLYVIEKSDEEFKLDVFKYFGVP